MKDPWRCEKIYNQLKIVTDRPHRCTNRSQITATSHPCQQATCLPEVTNS